MATNLKKDLLGQRFHMDSGDGDPRYFSQPTAFEVAERPWFSGHLPRGLAYLLVEINGPDEGKYFAITSRQQRSILEQLAQSDWVSVVLHVIKTPNSDFDPSSLEDAAAVGITALRLISRT